MEELSILELASKGGWIMIVMDYDCPRSPFCHCSVHFR